MDQKDIDYLKEIVNSQGFQENPSYRLIVEMIHDESARARTDSGVRAFIISKIPNFSKNIISIEYLKSTAMNYFRHYPYKDKILDCFNKTLQKEEFLNFLKHATDKFNESQRYGLIPYVAEECLRKVFRIFKEAAHHRIYETSVKEDLL